MMTGTVKWFNNTKGYGFVRADHCDDDLFVHYSYIQMEGYRSLKAGQRVRFEITHKDHGLHATSISLLALEARGEPEEAQACAEPA